MKFYQITSAIIGLLAVCTVAVSETKSAATMVAKTSNTGDTQKKQIESVVHDYIIQNPEVVVQSLQLFQQKQIDQAQKMMDKTRQLAPKYVTDLFNQANDPTAGNPNGKITLVEFFDYQCPHCTHMKPVLNDAIKANPDLRVIYKEFPIRGPVSDVAARAALAAKIQGKYDELHDALLEASSKGPLSEDVVYSTAASLGLDVNKLKADMKSPAINDQIKANTKLGQNLMLMGTPAVFVAKSDVKENSAPEMIAFVPGYVDANNLQVIITQVTKQ